MIHPHNEAAIAAPYRQWARSLIAQYRYEAYHRGVLEIAKRHSPEVALEGSHGLSLALVDEYIQQEAARTGCRSLRRLASFDGDISMAMFFHDNILNIPFDISRKYALITARGAWYRMMFNQSQRRVFEVSGGLAQKMRYTELRGLMASDLRAPYEAQFFVIPPEAGLGFTTDSGTTHIAEGAYLVERPTGQEDEFEGRSWAIQFVASQPGGDYAAFHFVLHLPDASSLEEQLAGFRDSIETPNMLEAWDRLFRWLMNVVMYTTSAEARTENVTKNPEAVGLREQMKKHSKGSSKYERARNRLRAINPDDRIYLGRGVKGLDLGGEQGPIITRTLVMGHWRNQACGTGRLERKRIFIEPHWRGPLDGIEGPSTHVL